MKIQLIYNLKLFYLQILKLNKFRLYIILKSIDL